MSKILISIQAVGDKSTRELLAGIIRLYLHPIKPKMRYYGDNGPVIWLRATINFDDIKSIDAFQDKYGNDILKEIRKHKIQGNARYGALYTVNITDQQVFQESI